MPKTHEELRAVGYVQARPDEVPQPGESLFRSKRPDYRVDEHGCWVWIKALSDAGYATDHGHRKYWARANGPIPKGVEIHHRCRNTACVNPDHLEAIHPRTHDVIHFLGERAGGLSLADVAEIRRLGLEPWAVAAAGTSSTRKTRHDRLGANREAMTLEDFVNESNRIEGILRPATSKEYQAHWQLFEQHVLTAKRIESFVKRVAGAPMRDEFGMNVRVGSHIPPPGSPNIRYDLENLMKEISDGQLTPYQAHVRYETLHPFMDGNGRSGRAVWAWQMQRDGLDPFALPFLHRFYYQSLDGAR